MAAFLVLSTLLAAALAATYAWFSHRHSHWRRRGVAQPRTVFPFGNIRDSVLGRTRLEFVLKDVYNQFRGEKYVGIYAFSKPILVLIDPDMIRLVMVKDFDHFRDRAVSFNEQEPLNHNLFFLGGNKWKRLRTKLTPTFTSGKLKMMCQTMQECGLELVRALEPAALRGDALEVRKVCARYATDVIASVAFGVDCHCQRDPDAEFRQWGRKVFEPSVGGRVAQLMHELLPVAARALRLGGGTEKVSAYFRNMVKDTVGYRESHDITRSDFMHLLIQLKNTGFVDEEKADALTAHGEQTDNWKLSLDEVAAQAFVFFLAGFETSSTTMSFALYELALNPDVQRRLQQEVDSALGASGGQLTYDAVADMQYLDQVVAETLRKYPPGALLARRCTRRYQLPEGGPALDAGTTVFIPTYALHHDPAYFPEPARFDPDRFSEQQKAARPSYVYLPFGEGPRNCIGMRLGLLQTKIGLASLVSRFEVRRCALTAVPLQFNNLSFIPMPTHGIQLRLASRR